MFTIMATMDSSASHVQIKFVTKIEKYVGVQFPSSVPEDVTCIQLSSILSAAVESEDLIEEKDEKPEFDFLIQGELLRSSIAEYILANNISTETVIEIEYIIKHPSPTPEESIVHNDWVSCVQAMGDYILSGCYDNTVKLHTFDGKEILTIPAHTASVRCLAWINEDNDTKRFVTGSHDQLLHVWEWNSETNHIKCLYKCAGHALSVESVSSSPDGLQFASASRDSTLKIWTMDDRGVSVPNDDGPKRKKKRIDDAKTKVPLMTLSGHHESLSSVCWEESGKLSTAGMDHTIRLWDLESQSETQTIKSAKAFLCMDSSCISRKLITGSSDRHIRLWDPKMKDVSMVIANFSSHTGWVSSVKWSKEDENFFISGSYDKMAKLWDVRSPKAPLYDLTGHEDKVLTVDWSVTKYMLSGGADNAVNVFAYKSS